jgi:PAS domain S-box-containing protein
VVLSEARLVSVIAKQQNRFEEVWPLRPRQIALLALVLGLTAAGFIIARVLADQGTRRDAERRAEVAAAQIGGRAAQAASLTESLRRFMVSAGGTGVTSAQFAGNAFRWLSPASFPAAAWVEQVPGSQRAAYERRIGEPIVSPGSQGSLEPAGSRSSYLPATLVSGFPPLPLPGIDLGGEPGMAAALKQATRINGVAATPSWGAVGGTRGLFLVAPAPNLIDQVLRPGYVVLFVPDATLRAAAATSGVRLAVGSAPTANSGDTNTVRKTFQLAGQRFAVMVPQGSPQGTSAAVAWIILGTGLVLAGFVVALGLNAGRRAQAQAELDRIFNLSSDLIAVADFKGYFKRVNPAFERTLGYSNEELRSRPYVEFVHLEDRSPTLAATNELTQGRDVIEFENRYRRKDGSLVWLQWSARSAPEEAAIYAAARDVTERRQLEDEQAALRRVATAVARGGSPEDVFAATVAELHAVVAADSTALVRYEADGSCTFLAALGENGFEVGSRIPLAGESVTAKVRSTGRPARIDNFEDASGPIAERLRASGLRSGVGAPIVVEGTLWGVMVSGWTDGPPPRDAELRAAQFTDLVGTAIANAESRAELVASRARIVTTADQTRRTIERDLHDGAQQRLVTLTMKLRALEDGTAPRPEAVKRDVAEIAAGLDDVLDDLRETARGLHPVILSRGGLGPALKALGRRSLIPVELDVRVEQRLPEPVEVAAYYVVAEALTNAAKHAHASLVTVEVDVISGGLRVSVQDDGVGGANPARGSGLIGLTDRVEALGGRLSLHSPTGDGTTLSVHLPLAADQPPPPTRPVGLPSVSREM